LAGIKRTDEAEEALGRVIDDVEEILVGDEAAKDSLIVAKAD
jgi:hypothetical protein